jgi:hypothetical protein
MALAIDYPATEDTEQLCPEDIERIFRRFDVSLQA